MSSPEDAAMLQQMQQRLESVTAAKTSNAAVGKQLDEKLRVAFKNPPRRPNLSAERIKEEMERKEWHRSTTSMAASDEKLLMRELAQLRDKLAQQEACEKFQQWVDATRSERNERFEQHKALDQQLVQLQLGIRKLKLAAHVGAPVSSFVTLEVHVPEDRMGAVIGKQFAHVHRLEQQCSAMLEVDSKLHVVRVTSAPEQARAAKQAIEDVSLATNHSIGLHPDTVKVLLFQQAKHLHELEKTLGLKLDVSKAEGVLSVTASPNKAKALEQRLQELADGKTAIPLPAEVVPKLIGKKGERINQLMADSGALVDIDKVSNTAQLCGSQESVHKAETFIRELIDAHEQHERNFTPADSTLFPDPDFERFKFEFFAEFLMANKAKQLRLLRADAGDARIKVLKREKRIHVLGNKAQLAAMEDALRARVAEFERLHAVVHVPDHHVLSLVIGKKGSTIKQLESEGQAGHVRVDIQDDVVCVFAQDEASVATTREKIQAIVDKNQRSVFLTSRHIVAVLLAAKREKLSQIETSSGCKVYLPPPPAAGANNASRSSGDKAEQVKISLSGTLEAIQEAKRQLDELDEAHHVQYLPLDEDEIPTVIGKKGETVSALERSSGAKVHVLRGQSGDPSELEMIGTLEQLTSAQTAVDALLQTQNRQLLQLDAFATGVLIGRKGERIKAMRAEHPDAMLDAFPTRGHVRIKAKSPEALQACVAHVLQTLQDTQVVESVHVPQPQPQSPSQSDLKPKPKHKSQSSSSSAAPRVAPANFHTLLDQNASIASRLQELEAEGGDGMRVAFQDDGRTAKIRGPALGMGKMRRFLEMLVARDSHFVETIALPSMAFASALQTKPASDADADASATATSTVQLNENALRICRQTGCELRIKRVAAISPSGAEQGEVRVEGADPAKVYKAKAEVYKVLQFYFTECFGSLENLPPSVVSRLYELLPSLRASFPVQFSLPTKTTLKVWTDSKTHTHEITARLEREVDAWKKQHVEISVPGWLVPMLLGRSGETIKKISAESNGARLDLSAPSPAAKRQEDRVLTISARDADAIQAAAEKVHELLALHRNLASAVHVPRNKLDVALSAKKNAASGLQFHVVDGDAKNELQVLVYGSEFEERERVVEKMEHLLETYVVESMALPTHVSATAASNMAGALIGKSGANIRALQKQFPGVLIDIRRGESSVSLKGPTADVQQVRQIMQDKLQELVRLEDEFQQRRSARQHEHEHEPEAETHVDEDKPKADGARAAGDVADENAHPNGAQQQAKRMHVGPVGGAPAVNQVKLTKNQRRRMRKRAENDKQGNVLSMLMGEDQASASFTTTTTSTTVSSSNGDSTSSSTTAAGDSYYHSSSGYSLRL